MLSFYANKSRTVLFQQEIWIVHYKLNIQDHSPSSKVPTFFTFIPT